MEFINQNILLISIVVISGLGLLWPQFLALLLIGTVLFGASLAWFRRALARMA